jgi:tetratricopeptide (TPR) repeat protein
MARQQRENRRLLYRLEHLLNGELTNVSRQELDDDIKNIFASVKIGAENGDVDTLLKFIQGLAKLLHQKGYWKEAAGQIAAIPELIDRRNFTLTAHQEADLAYWLGLLYDEQGKDKEAGDQYEKSADIAEQLGERDFQARSLLRLGWLTHKALDYEQARQHYIEAQSLWNSTDEPLKSEGLSRSLHHLGMLAFDQGRDETAERYFQESLELRRRIGDRWMEAASLHHLGGLAEWRQQWQRAEQYHTQALELRLQIGDLPGQASSHYQLALVYQAQQNLDAAKAHANTSLKIREATGDEPGKILAQFLLGDLACQEKRWEEAPIHFAAAQNWAEKIHDLAHQAKALYQLGWLAQRQANPDIARARQYYRDSTELFQKMGEKTGDRSAYAKVLHQWGWLEKEAEDYPAARRLLEESLAIRRAVGRPNEIAQTLFRLGMVAIIQEDFVVATEYFQQSADSFGRAENPQGQADALEWLRRLKQVTV